MENEEIIINEEASTLKKALEALECRVLYFNSLYSESIATLLEALNKTDHSLLSMIALIFLSKGKTPEPYDANNVVIPFEEVFAHFQSFPIPKVFFFDSACGNVNDFSIPIYPENSIILVAIHTSLESSPVVEEFTKKLSHTNVQKCFKEICAHNNDSRTVKSKWHDNIGSSFFIVKSIIDR